MDDYADFSLMGYKLLFNMNELNNQYLAVWPTRHEDVISSGYTQDSLLSWNEWDFITNIKLYFS